MKRKLELMHEMFGADLCHTCGECTNFVSGLYHDRILRKCAVYGLTHSASSDWAKRWTACGMFNQEYNGRNIIELGLGRQKASEEPIAGQLFMLGEGSRD